MSLGEFDLIKKYFLPISEASYDASVALGIGDDCAVLNPPKGQQLVVSIDTLVEGVHFINDTAPEQIATRLIGAAVSDLAAMGAEPAWLTLALTLPKADEDWISCFAATLAEQCNHLGLALIGGDTTRGPLAVTAQVHGFVPTGQAIKRTGAKIDDLICVSGTLGDSRAGLEGLLNGHPHQPSAEYLQSRFYSPAPRIELGQTLKAKASAAIDVSDGLLSDLSHILKASGGLGARIQLEALPISKPLLDAYGEEQSRQWALSGGEDFELCFTLPAGKLPELMLLGIADKFTVIGKVIETPDIQLFLRGEPCEISGEGYDHFRASS